MKKIVFIIGASGSGKTTVAKELEKTSLSDFKIIYFDSIGVPSFDEMIEKYQSPEEWQRVKTFEWVEIIKTQFISSTNVILDGQIRPEFIEAACTHFKIESYEIILFDCENAERTKRLVKRGHAELANEQMMNWASYLRRVSQEQGYPILDTTF